VPNVPIPKPQMHSSNRLMMCCDFDMYSTSFVDPGTIFLSKKIPLNLTLPINYPYYQREMMGE